MADKNFNTVSVVTAVNDTDTLHITTGGTHARVSVDTLIAKAKAQTLTEIEAALLDKLTDGCFVMYHHKSDNYPRTVRASSWTGLQSGGDIADGVLVISGGRHVVVAPTQASEKLSWSSSNVAVDSSKVITNRALCFADFDGKDRTSAILANTTIGGDGGDFAPGYCAAYSRSNGVDYSATEHPENSNYGLKAGMWWLPSIGELLLIYQNKQKINTCLKLITGASQLSENYYWSSTESSQRNAWTLGLSNADMGNGSKNTIQAYVRAVTAFLR